MKYSFAILLGLFPWHLWGSEGSIYIYQDADLSNYAQSSAAIQKGIEVAFDEIGNEINGYKIEYKYLDHRGNVVRSKRNYKTFIDDPRALAIYSGIHSPPLIKNREYINLNKALTLVPWATGGPITRHPSSENWIFRLSIDDTRVGPVMVDFALNQKSCKKPRLLLEETPWGDLNHRSLSKALLENNIEDFQVSRFSWNLKKTGARALLHAIFQEESDCILFVGNAEEGAIIMGEMAAMPLQSRMPVISHWGISAGNFHEIVPAAARGEIDLHFIQTCFAFTNTMQSELSERVFTNLKRLSNGVIDRASDLKAAVGFIHAYDLSKLLIQAIRQTGLSGNIKKDRENIRLALETLEQPVLGLIREYNSPFSELNKDTNTNAHEALNAKDYCMGRYGPSNEVLLTGM